MKKFFITALLLLAVMAASAQKEVTEFLGIPVDGKKSKMIKKLEAKGFTKNPYVENMLSGEFNGKNVNVHVVTNGNKVYRIMVDYVRGLDENDIKVQFNVLCRQFKNNKKYVAFIAEELSDEEDISHEMAVNHKRYEASFHQSLTGRGLPEELDDAGFGEIVTNVINRSVWFMINEDKVSGSYEILIYYDNEYNKANGEDL